MKRLIFATVLIASFTLSGFCQFPRLSVDVDHKTHDLEINSIQVSIEVIGNIATTTFDVSFFNSFNRNLEAELTLPLAEGQQVSRYALEIDNKLREGVVVEKVKARQVFEAIVSRKVDPGIANLTKGNTFSTRIFPVPANGYKRVVLAITETLNGDDTNLYYTMPVVYEQKIGKFNLNVKVLTSGAQTNQRLKGFDNIDFDSQDNAYLLNFKRENYTLSEPIKFTIPRFSNADHELYTGEFEGRTYFYLIAKTPELPVVNKPDPASIGIYWDNSFSAYQRDIRKELDFLELYLSALPGTKKVTVNTFNYKAGEARTFDIAKDVSGLKDYLLALKNDGATKLENVVTGNKYDVVLLFTDALNTISTDDLKLPEIPVHTITSATGSNYSFLKRISTLTNGEFIDLNYLKPDEAVGKLRQNETQLLKCSFDNREIEEVYPDLPSTAGKYVEVSGKLKRSTALITLNFGHAGQIESSMPINITNGINAPVTRIWAQKKIESLQPYSGKDTEEIAQLGTRFNIITPGTSFIVLENLMDYYQYNIEPPDDLKDAYFNMVSGMPKRQDLAEDKPEIDRNNQSYFENLTKWYGIVSKTQPAGENDIGAKSTVYGNNNLTQRDSISQGVELLEGVEVTAEAISRIHIDRTSVGATISEETVIVSDDLVIYDFSEDEESILEASEPTGLIGKKPDKNTSIKILAWQPDAPYMSILRDARDSIEMEELYFQVKEDNLLRPSFYIEVSDYLFNNKMHNMAVRVMTNVLELDLENPELLKTAGHRLLNEKESEIAIQIYKEVSKLRPEEPQSFRDLAKAYIANGQYDLALQQYEYILDNSWSRFEGIREVVLNEFNHLIAAHGDELTVSEKFRKFIQPMPLDIRVVIDWSSNENDIDLWVTDPNGEKCYYGHPTTKMGGKITSDFTRGYGPEEFSVKKAKPGNYKIQVNYYGDTRQSITGPVTVYATMYTNYGKPNEEKKQVAIQLTKGQKAVLVAELKFDESI